MSKLERYGLEWKSDQDFVCHPMDDGYWTPWHIAEEQNTTLRQQLEQAQAGVAELDEQKRKLKWKLAYQAMHHVRLHNRWVCGDLEAPEEESIVNPFVYAETEVWWAIGDEADGFAKELEADEIEKAGGGE